MKCVNCEHGGNNSEGTYICFKMNTGFWMKDVLNKEFHPTKKQFQCEHYSEKENLGDRLSVEYPYNTEGEFQPRCWGR